MVLITVECVRVVSLVWVSLVFFPCMVLCITHVSMFSKSIFPRVRISHNVCKFIVIDVRNAMVCKQSHNTWVSFQFIDIVCSIIVTVLSNTIKNSVCIFKTSSYVGIIANLGIVSVMPSLHEQANKPTLSITAVSGIKSVSYLRKEPFTTTR